MANITKTNKKSIEWHFQEDLSVNILLKGNFNVCACIHTHTIWTHTMEYYSVMRTKETLLIWDNMDGS